MSFGAKVKTAAAGTVIVAQDGLPDQTPGIVPNLPLSQIPGNNVVIDQGGGFYDFYAHLKSGSVMVKVGDTVEVGQQLGQLGNSGGSSAPHLHFHVVLGPSPIASNSAPYVFDSFQFAGTANPANLEVAITGKGPLFIPTQPPVMDTQELPLDYVVVNFPSTSP